MTISRSLPMEIVYFAGGEWHLYPPRGYDLMKVLAAKGNRILWVDPSATRLPKIALTDATRIAARLRRVVAGVHEPLPNLWVCSPLAVPYEPGSGARLLNSHLQGVQVRRALRRLGIERPIVWTTTPLAVDVIQTLQASLLVYDIQDEYTRFPGKDHQSARDGEDRLLRHADLTFAVSEELRRVKNPPSRSEILLVPNGVDFELFSKARDPDTAIPASLKMLPRPMAGYVGNIYERMDFGLVAEAARRLPDWSFVFVGLVRCELGEATRLRNVYFQGMKPPDSLPSFLKAFDVAMIPHRVDPFTVCQNPVKLYEYLAAGLPIVSSPLPELEPYRDWVRTGRDGAEFSAALQQALSDTAPERIRSRQEIARQNTWEKRAGQIAEFLQARLAGGV